MLEILEPGEAPGEVGRALGYSECKRKHPDLYFALTFLTVLVSPSVARSKIGQEDQSADNFELVSTVLLHLDQAWMVFLLH